MLDTALVTTGHGYQTGSHGRCTAFDGFTIIANPLGEFSDRDRERRIFLANDGPGVTYGSHALYLMTREEREPRAFYIGIHNGSGRQVWRIPACFEYLAETIEELTRLRERALYSLLYGIVKALNSTRRAAESDTAHEWRVAAVDKRVKVRRQTSKGRAQVWIEPKREPGETDVLFGLRCKLAAPSARR